MAEPRIIKKYPNRRLYDTGASQYITLEDLRQLVLAKEPFTVVDSKSGEEITRTILLQIISEQEEKGAPVFSSQLLEQIIRSRSDALRHDISQFLEKSLFLFLERQTQLQREMVEKITRLPANPMELMGEMARLNTTLWSQWQESLFIGKGSSKKMKSEEKNNPPDAPEKK